MAAFGFTINTLTMFGLVLAIGLLVDDAIVVVENVERVMAEEGLSPREATRKSMGQITGALVGVAVVLSAVFVPVAFSGGSVGAIYRQFSLTIVVGDAAFGVRRAVAHAGALRHDAEAAWRRRRGRRRVLRRVQSRLRARARQIRRRRASGDESLRTVAADLWRADRRRRVAVRCGCRPDFFPTRIRASCTCRCRRRSGRDAGAYARRARRGVGLPAA